MLLLGVGLLGAYFGVRGEDPRLPWPPPPVVPPANSEESKPPPIKQPVRQPAPKPVAPKEVLAPNPVVQVHAETKTATDPMALPTPAPIEVELPKPAPAPNPFVIPDVNSVPIPLPPAITPMQEESVKIDSTSNGFQTQTVAASSPPVIKTVPEGKANETIVVLPPTETSAPAPTPVPSNPEPPAVIPPMPNLEKQVDVLNAGPTVQEKTTSPTVPARPRAFQLVNPIRRSEPIIPDALPDLPINNERPMVQAQPVAQTNPKFPVDRVVGNATPQVTVEKRGPVTSRPGEPMQFTIVVRNVGPNLAKPVRVEDDIPPGARVLSADPVPEIQSDRAVWVIPLLRPGAEKQLKIELQAQGGGELMSQTSVQVATTTGTRIQLPRENMSLVVKAPTSVPVGRPVVFEVTVTNHSQQRLTKLVLYGRLPPGLTHKFGKEIEAEVGDLDPGATKTYPMPVTAALPGKQKVDVKISSQNGIEANGQGTVTVTSGSGAALSIKQSPNVRLFQDRPTELRIEVTNNQPQGVQNVSVIDTLPNGVEFIACSDRGIFRPEARTAFWLIDTLAPGQTQSLVVNVQGKKPGQFENDVTVSTDLNEIKSLAKVQVQAIADLVVKVTDRENPIEVGKNAVYQIEVINQGSAAATGVMVQATLPQGMDNPQMRGPTNHRLEGKQIIFGSLPKLQPNGQALYYVTALAQAPGEQRFLAQVTCDQESSPIVREQRTFVYRD